MTGINHLTVKVILVIVVSKTVIRSMIVEFEHLS